VEHFGSSFYEVGLTPALVGCELTGLKVKGTLRLTLSQSVSLGPDTTHEYKILYIGKKGRTLDTYESSHIYEISIENLQLNDNFTKILTLYIM
jgi:hypothetical protein